MFKICNISDIMICSNASTRTSELLSDKTILQGSTCSKEDAGNLSNKLVHYLWHFQSLLCASEVIPIDSVANKGSKHHIDH